METFRAATAEDAVPISNLDDEVFPDEGMSEMAIARELAAGRATVAEGPGGLVGYVLFRPGEVGDVLRIAVRAGCRGRGIGLALLLGALGAMSGPVILTVRKSNVGALRLYRRLDLRAVAEIETSWVMRRG